MADTGAERINLLAPTAEKKKGALARILESLPDILSGTAAGYAAGAGDSNIPEAAFARGFSTQYETGKANRKQRDVEDQQGQLKSRLEGFKRTPTYAGLSEQDKLLFDVAPGSILGRAKTAKIRLSQINPKISPELDREIEVPEDKLPEMMKQTETLDETASGLLYQLLGVQAQPGQRISVKAVPSLVALANARTKANSVQDKLSEAEKAVDKNFAKDYADFVLQGGYADVQKGLSQLSESVKKMENGQQATGPILGLIPKAGRDIVNPGGASIQDSVEEVVQRNLRLIFGPQFTEKEGTMLMARAYNPRQPESENISRINRLIRQMDEAAQAKVRAGQYYEQNGTMAGYKGTIYTSPSQFLKDEPAPEAPKDAGAITTPAPTGTGSGVDLFNKLKKQGRL